MVRSLLSALVLAFVCSLRVALAQSAPAAPTPEPAVPTDDQWHYAVTPYAWLPSIHANSNVHNPGVFIPSPVNIGVTVSPGSYLGGLNFGLMAAFEARRKGTTLLFDYIYSNISTSAAAITTITGPNGHLEFPISSSVNAHAFFGISTLAVGITAYAKNASNLDVIAGIRTVSSHLVADYSLTGPITEIPHTGSASRTIFLMDPIIGIKGRVGLAARFYIPYEADFGAGADNTTFQYLAGVAYAGRTNDVIAGYRVLGYNQGEEQPLQHLNLAGPFIGLRIHW